MIRLFLTIVATLAIAAGIGAAVDLTHQWDGCAADVAACAERSQ